MRLKGENKQKKGGNGLLPGAESVQRKNRTLDDPRDGDPLRLLLQLACHLEKVLKGRREIGVDDDVVKPVAVMEFHPLSRADHLLQLVIGKSAPGKRKTTSKHRKENEKCRSSTDEEFSSKVERA